MLRNAEHQLRLACLVCGLTALFALPAAGQTFQEQAVTILTQTEFQLPAQTHTLWAHDDGLPEPNDAEFADGAAQFLEQHPVPPAATRESAAWAISAVASRQLKCLSYLASGAQAARQQIAQLCVTQAVQLQWRFPIPAGGLRRQQLDRSFYAAASSLAVTGVLLRAGAEERTLVDEVARLWQLTGTGQLATSGHRGEKSLLVLATDLVDLADKANRPTIHGTDQEFFEQLDLERPDMRAVATCVSARDWPAARDAYAQVLAKRFTGDWPDLETLVKIDQAETDDICRNVFVIQGHMHVRHDYGKAVDWAKVIDNDIESRVWMNHHVWIGQLHDAYLATQDEKYITHLCRLLNSWYETSLPTFTRSWAQWRTLEVGARASYSLPLAIIKLANNPTYREQCAFNVARSMLDHGKYLSMYAAPGGNWLQVEACGLACVAAMFPEFKLSGTFWDIAMNRLARVNATAFLADGFQAECSPLYHFFPMNRISIALAIASSADVQIPPTLQKQYGSGVQALAQICYPNNLVPVLNDGIAQPRSGKYIVQRALRLFPRDDFRWLATAGREGKPPAETSHDFTHAGFCVMRDKWGPDGQMLIFDAGYFGSGHQHEDKLNFVYYAGGRELIGDPGIYSYNRDEFEPYWRGSWSHNTIVIDGLSQHRALGPAEEMPDPDRRFVMGEEFDFASAWYRRAYSPRQSGAWGRQDPKDAEAAIRDVQHQRCVFYVKGRYAVICDRVLGEGEHQVDTLFHPAPVLVGEGIPPQVRPVELEIRQDGAVVTKEREHANVAILPASMTDVQVLDVIGQEDPRRGWYSLYGIQPSHDIVYRWRGQLPRHSETVIQPCPVAGGPLKVESRDVVVEDGKCCAALSCGHDLLLISYDGPADMRCGDVRFVGTAVLLSRDEAGRPLSAHMVDAEYLTLKQSTVFTTEEPASAKSIDL